MPVQMNRSFVAVVMAVLSCLLLPSANAQKESDDNLVPVELATVGFDRTAGAPLVLLRHPESGRVLPIWIGAMEAQAIALALHGIVVPRPMTHDLMANLLTELRARVDSILRIKRAHDEVLASKRRLEQLAIRDDLTGVYNYRYLHTRLSEEFKRAQRYRYPLACAMIDIDHFKRFNDDFGHDTGDLVLREVAARISGAVRDVDVVARYGGEEFLLMLPNTHFAGALTVADRVWRGVGQKVLAVGERRHKITVSVGVSLYPSRDIKTKDQLLKSADEALYRAKHEGRDRICVFQQQGYLYRPDVPGSAPPPSYEG
jgi:diguanylate cyclase (GGDEF)-like protein